MRNLAQHNKSEDFKKILVSDITDLKSKLFSQQSSSQKYHV